MKPFDCAEFDERGTETESTPQFETSKDEGRGKCISSCLRGGLPGGLNCVRFRQLIIEYYLCGIILA